MRRSKMVQDMQEDHGIQPAGDGQEDFLAVAKELSGGDALLDLVNPTAQYRVPAVSDEEPVHSRRIMAQALARKRIKCFFQPRWTTGFMAWTLRAAASTALRQSAAAASKSNSNSGCLLSKSISRW